MTGVLVKTELQRLSSSFPFGKKLANEILDRLFLSHSDNRVRQRNRKMIPEPEIKQQELLCLFRRWNKWRSSTEWLKGITEVRDGLLRYVYHNNFDKIKKMGILFSGFRAESFGKEVLSYIRFISCVKGRSSKNTQQLSIDALETLIKGSRVEARTRKEWIDFLTKMCREYKLLPRSLKLEGLLFPGTESEASSLAPCGSSDIFCAQLMGQTVVVKVLRYFELKKCKDPKWSPLHEEALAYLSWLGLHHPGLNSFLGVAFDVPRQVDSAIGLVLRYQKHGNSVEYLRRLLGYMLQDRTAWVCKEFAQIMSAIDFLHRMELTHSDIKGENILVDDDGRPCLTDFGLASNANSPRGAVTSTYQSGYGSGGCTVRFSSKERVFEGKRSKEDDIWAIGMTLIQLLTDKLPFECMDEPSFLNGLKEGGLRLQDKYQTLEESIPDALYNLIKRCLSIDIADRPIAFELYTIMENISGSQVLNIGMAEGYQ